METKKDKKDKGVVIVEANLEVARVSLLKVGVLRHHGLKGLLALLVVCVMVNHRLKLDLAYCASSASKQHVKSSEATPVKSYSDII